MKTLRLLLILIAAAVIVAFVIWKDVEKPLSETKMIGFQDQAAPFSLASGDTLDMRFYFPSAWVANQVPSFKKMDPPMGSENGGFTYNAQQFWEMNPKRGGHHSGDDLNGIGGMNTDLGDSVYAAAHGLVIYTGAPSDSWGKVVMLAHKKMDGTQIRTMYAHLDTIKVRRGQLIARGKVIGTVGTGNGHYLAHLHFELSSADGIPIDRGYLKNPLARMSPSSFIAAHHSASADGISPSALAFADFGKRSNWTSLEIQGAEKFSELKSEPEN